MGISGWEFQSKTTDRSYLLIKFCVFVTGCFGPCLPLLTVCWVFSLFFQVLKSPCSLLLHVLLYRFLILQFKQTWTRTLNQEETQSVCLAHDSLSNWWALKCRKGMTMWSFSDVISRNCSLTKVFFRSLLDTLENLPSLEDYCWRETWVKISKTRQYLGVLCFTAFCMTRAEHPPPHLGIGLTVDLAWKRLGYLVMRRLGHVIVAVVDHGWQGALVVVVAPERQLAALVPAVIRRRRLPALRHLGRVHRVVVIVRLQWKNHDSPAQKVRHGRKCAG